MRTQKRKEYCFVRFSKEQYDDITIMAELRGTTVASLLRDSYFRRSFRTPNVPHQLAIRVGQLVQDVDTLLNALTDLADKGFREGFHPEIERARKATDEIIDFVGGKRGYSMD